MPIGLMATFAQFFLGYFSFAQLLMVLLVGPALVAPAIAVERERRTIEYLFATDLTNAEIVFGKLLSRFASLAALVAVGLPILALTTLLGGVDTTILLQSFVITGGAMLAVTSLALVVSVRSAKVRDALAKVYLILLLLLVPPMILGASRALGFWSPAIGWISSTLEEANPLATMAKTLWMATTQGGGSWPTVLLMLRDDSLFAAAMLLLACWSVRRVHLGQVAATASKKQIAFATRGRPVGDWPIPWREMRGNRRVGRWAIERVVSRLFIGLLAVGVFALFWKMRGIHYGGGGQPQTEFVGIARAAMMVLTDVVLVLIALRSASSITTERERETWLTLLSTPLTAREFVWGKFLGNLHSARLAGWAWLYLIALAAYDQPSVLKDAPYMIVTTLILAAFAGILGIFCSLSFKSTQRAQGACAGSLLVPGRWVLDVLCSDDVPRPRRRLLRARALRHDARVRGLLFFPGILRQDLRRVYRGQLSLRGAHRDSVRRDNQPLRREKRTHGRPGFRGSAAAAVQFPGRFTDIERSRARCGIAQ